MIEKNTTTSQNPGQQKKNQVKHGINELSHSDLESLTSYL
jgi:hypothetical protein